MANLELQNLDKNIKRLKAQLANKRNTLVTIAPEEQMRIEQQIEDLKEQIQKLEQEKYELIASLAQEVEIPETEAEPLIAEIITEVEGVTTQPPDKLSQEMLDYLQQILAKLNEPEQPASAKLKAGISALPPFVSLGYEVELDTESTFRRYLPNFGKLVKRVSSAIAHQ